MLTAAIPTHGRTRSQTGVSKKPRKNISSKMGAPTDVISEEECSRETDGLVIAEDNFGECEGFENACDEVGLQRRRNIRCEGGQEVGQVEARECERETDGLVVDEGDFGECGSFDGV